jgi:hypothetical protein
MERGAGLGLRALGAGRCRGIRAHRRVSARRDTAAARRVDFVRSGAGRGRTATRGTGDAPGARRGQACVSRHRRCATSQRLGPGARGAVGSRHRRLCVLAGCSALGCATDADASTDLDLELNTDTDTDTDTERGGAAGKRGGPATGLPLRRAHPLHADELVRGGDLFPAQLPGRADGWQPRWRAMRAAVVPLACMYREEASGPRQIGAAMPPLPHRRGSRVLRKQVRLVCCIGRPSQRRLARSLLRSSRLKSLPHGRMSDASVAVVRRASSSDALCTSEEQPVLFPIGRGAIASGAWAIGSGWRRNPSAARRSGVRRRPRRG